MHLAIKLVQAFLTNNILALWCCRSRSRRLCLRTVPTNSKVFLRGLLDMREKQILTSVIEIQKKIGGNHAYFEDN